MFRIFTSAILTAFLILGCASKSNPNARYPDLPISEGELRSDQWEKLRRFPPRFPEAAAQAGEMGCATVEYVILPNYQVTDIFVVASSGREFSRSAQRVISRWSWKSLPAGLLTEPIKTRTRFDFCFPGASPSCGQLLPRDTCPGDDVMRTMGLPV